MNTATPKQKLKLSIALVTSPGFLTALDRLGEDNLSTGDKYALARTKKDIQSHLETFRDQHLQLVKKHGEPELHVVARRVAELEANAPQPGSQEHALLANLREHRERIAKQPETTSWAVDEGNAEVMKAFSAELAELRKVEFQVFLDHQIVLPEFSKLSAKDIGLLLDIVAQPEEKPEPAAAE